MKRIVCFFILAIFCSVILSAEGTTYNPGDRREYIFAETSSEYGYLFMSVFETLTDAESFGDPVDLDVNKYKLRKFYAESVLKRDGERRYYSIVIEPGERYVYEKRGPIDDISIGGYRFHDEYLAFRDLIDNRAALYPGSNIHVIDGEFNTYSDIYFFNNGGKLFASEWADIKTILDYSQVKGQKKETVASLFTKSNLYYDVDDFDRIAFIKIGNDAVFVDGKYKVIYTPLEFYIGVQNGRVWGRLRAVYQGSDWLFANAITLGADKERWNSGDVTFNRETVDYGVMEVMDIPSDNSIVSFMEEFVSAKDTRIRFRGDTQNIDKTLSQEDIEAQANILSLYHAMKDEF
jgi:hypothetical protein